MKIGIIGAGPSGLAAIKQAQDYNVDCVAFEVTDDVGGAWVYREMSGHGGNDSPTSLLQNSMYKSLRTNLPVQLMQFGDFKFEPKSGLCYPSHEEVLAYIQDYVQHFNLLKHIKFGREVIRVSREEKTYWKIVVKNIKDRSTEEYKFDAIMVCSGHNNVPFYPNIPGMDTFPGNQMHSKQYRENTRYTGKTVLIMGVGASGLDFTYDCSKVAQKVILCHRRDPVECIKEPNVVQKPVTKRIDKDVIHFADGTSERVDAIIYCTGYVYDFSYLDSSCGIHVDEGMILNPLYKFFISINEPSLCFLGLLQKSIVFPLCDIQANVFIKSLTNKIELPSKEVMLLHRESQEVEKRKKGVSKSHYYYLGAVGMREYLLDLCDMGNIKRLPEVTFFVYKQNMNTFKHNYKNLRNYEIRITDENNFKYREINSGS